MAMKLKQQIEIKLGGRVPPTNFETANTVTFQHSTLKTFLQNTHWQTSNKIPLLMKCIRQWEDFVENL